MIALTEGRPALLPSQDPIDPSLPSVTVVMPILDEGRWIETSLGAVLRQDYPDSLVEILIADSGSSDDTIERIADIRERNSQRRVHVLENRRRTPGAALNLMIGHATGEIVIRVDGHSEVAPDYVRGCVGSLRTSEAVNVGGSIGASGSGVVGRAVAAAIGTFWGNGGARYRSHPPDRPTYVDTVQFGAWRRETLLRLGPFVEEWPVNEDCEFNARIRDTGGKILLDPAIRATYFPRPTLRSLARQYFRYGYLKWNVIVRHPRQLKARQLAPAFLVLGLAASVVAVLVGPAGSPLPLVAPGAYLSAILIAAAHIAVRNRLRSSAWVLPAVLAAMHLSYGFGVLLGFGEDLVARLACVATRALKRRPRRGRSSPEIGETVLNLKDRDGRHALAVILEGTPKAGSEAFEKH